MHSTFQPLLHQPVKRLSSRTGHFHCTWGVRQAHQRDYTATPNTENTIDRSHCAAAAERLCRLLACFEIRPPFFVSRPTMCNRFRHVETTNFTVVRPLRYTQTHTILRFILLNPCVPWFVRLLLLAPSGTIMDIRQAPLLLYRQMHIITVRVSIRKSNRHTILRRKEAPWGGEGFI